MFLTLSPAVTDGESGLRVGYELGSNPIQDTAGNDADRLSNKSVSNKTGDTTGTDGIDGANHVECRDRTGPTAWTTPLK